MSCRCRPHYIVTGASGINRQLPNGLSRLILLSGILFLSGCSPIKQTQDTVETVPQESIAAPAEPAAPTPVSTPAPSRILILLSDDVSSYVQIGEKILQLGPQHDYLTVNLDRRKSLKAEHRKHIELFNPDRIVAIGLNAARAGQSFNDIPMIFCQVFNFEDHELLSSTSDGVKLLPPFSLQFELWKELSPELRTTGIITGAGQKSLVEEIRKAASEHNIELLTHTVQSDKETLFTFKRMTPKIQGFLLLPDNRVLSPGVLREMISYSKKHGTQIVVFNSKLLQIGADISFSSRNADIADTVLRIIDVAPDKKPDRPSQMTALTTLHMEFSTEVAQKLDAQTEENLARYLDSE
jgi:ABC-type uncharacterized transport system substrate-binding protein